MAKIYQVAALHVFGRQAIKRPPLEYSKELGPGNAPNDR
jgi:hypothetical protein